MHRSKFLYVSIIFLQATSRMFSQQAAMFEMPIFFKDGLGNRDTIIIGGDTTAVQGFNPQFGEVQIDLPFDSIFEVRATNIDDITLHDGILTKKVIGWTEHVYGSEEPCDIIEPIFFVASIRHLPLSIYWEKGRFQDSFCISESYISTSLGAWLLGYWVFDEPYFDPYYCMASNDSISLDSFPDFSTWVFDFEYEIEGEGLQPLFVFYISFSLPGLDGPCENIVSTKETNFYNENIELYPNPTSDFISIKWPEFGKEIYSIDLFDSCGKLLLNSKKQSGSIQDGNELISLKEYQPGIYFLAIHTNQGLTVKKIIKI